MENKFLDNPIIIKDIPKNYPVNQFLLENNEKQISQICDFLQGSKKLLLLNGFRGCGKTSIINFVADSVNQDVLVLNYTCFETTILDDMLLSFFESFKMYTLMGKITQPRIKVDNFNQKINSYF